MNIKLQSKLKKGKIDIERIIIQKSTPPRMTKRSFAIELLLDPFLRGSRDLIIKRENISIYMKQGWKNVNINLITLA